MSFRSTAEMSLKNQKEVKLRTDAHTKIIVTLSYDPKSSLVHVTGSGYDVSSPLLSMRDGVVYLSSDCKYSKFDQVSILVPRDGGSVVLECPNATVDGKPDALARVSQL